MANLITHVFLGNSMISKLISKPYYDVIVANKDAFALGNMGPDFIYSLREIGKKAGRLANFMHATKVFEVFDKLETYVHNQSSAPLMAYALGMLCHYATDAVFHPYVNFVIEERLPQHYIKNYVPMLHTLVELCIDDYIITSYMGFPKSNEYNFPKDIQCKRLKVKEIGKMYQELVAPIFGIKFSALDARLAFFITRLFMKITHDKRGKRAPIIERYELKKDKKMQLTCFFRPRKDYKDIDILNNFHLPYRAVRNEEATFNYNVDEMLQISTTSAIALMDTFFAREPLNPSDFSINYEGSRI